jgi:hypothetical protein
VIACGFYFLQIPKIQLADPRDSGVSKGGGGGSRCWSTPLSSGTIYNNSQLSVVATTNNKHTLF